MTQARTASNSSSVKACYPFKLWLVDLRSQHHFTIMIVITFKEKNVHDKKKKERGEDKDMQ